MVPIQSPTQTNIPDQSLPPWPQVAPTPSGRPANPLSSKITVLASTSYTDGEFRSALSLLDERRAQNTPETRRQLRLELQKEVIDSNGDIINDFGKVAKQLGHIGIIIERLNECYSHMKNEIIPAHDATSSLLHETCSLMAENERLRTKQDVLGAFNATFLLSDEEVATLTVASEPVDHGFFAALAKAKRIVKDCEVLLGLERQAIGLEIIEQTSKHISLAFQKLYRWIQGEFKTINMENPQISSSIRLALRVLAEKPALFQKCLDFFAEAREQILSDAFHTALTGALASGLTDVPVKPIELVAHDPLRYVGDMLAWTHSAAVGEKEALEVLFVSDGDEIAKGIQAGRDQEVWRLLAEEDEQAAVFDAVAALSELVDGDMSGVARMVRQRVEQVIQNNEDTILAYKLANLLDFYKTTFKRLLMADSVLVDALGNLETEAHRQFRSLMRDHIATLQADSQQPPGDLSAPDFLQDSLVQLRAIMKTYDTSFTASSDRDSDFQPILAEAFDPFMSRCDNMAKTVDPPADSIFMLNCLFVAKTALEPFEFAHGRLMQLEANVEEEAAKLIKVQYVYFRTQSGLDALITALDLLRETGDDLEKMLSLEAVQDEALAESSQTLDNFLPSALMEALQNLRQLKDSNLARRITETAAERFCVDFEHVEQMMILADELAYSRHDQEAYEEDTGPQRLRASFPRTSAEIRVLLS